ncbi:hypothetical protein C7212DRAFT_347643 [Tuber magnatum]|uniref:Uncharacterized protein n=1 Tax=Tuber magnatum TaxID=42249 RepID=A0A317SH58_9PEZI|nr:hypothetical protein C7212DRAFT_347643 [Tuber magnatum]
MRYLESWFHGIAPWDDPGIGGSVQIFGNGSWITGERRSQGRVCFIELFRNISALYASLCRKTYGGLLILITLGFLQGGGHENHRHAVHHPGGEKEKKKKHALHFSIRGNMDVMRK